MAAQYLIIGSLSELQSLYQLKSPKSKNSWPRKDLATTQAKGIVYEDFGARCCEESHGT